MGFKKISDYNEERYGNKFILKNDGDYADVIFLYRNYAEDVMVAASHYIKSVNYNGYAFCTGKGCPACAKGIRVQHRLFIPLYNIDANEIQFFDRTTKFDVQLQRDVFKDCPNPSEYVFRITRHGESNSIDTRYEITVVAKNNVKSYDEILAQFNTSLPEYYEEIIKEFTASELMEMLNSKASEDTSQLPSYKITPRKNLNIPNFDEVVGDSSEDTNYEEIDDVPDFE